MVANLNKSSPAHVDLELVSAHAHIMRQSDKRERACLFNTNDTSKVQQNRRKQRRKTDFFCLITTFDLGRSTNATGMRKIDRSRKKVLPYFESHCNCLASVGSFEYVKAKFCFNMYIST